MPCEQCEFATGLPGQLARHIKVVHDNIKKFTCDQCSYKTDKPCYMRRHVKTVHDKIKSTNGIQLAKTINRFEKLAEEEDMNKEDINKDSDSESCDLSEDGSEDEMEQVRCYICPHLASNQKTLTSHILSMHVFDTFLNQ